MEKRRNNYTPEEKVQILKKHLIDKIPVSDICDKYKLHPNVFYKWQKQFFENGSLVFVSKKDKQIERLNKRIAGFEDKILKKNEVLSELMEAHIALKKSLGKS